MKKYPLCLIILATMSSCGTIFTGTKDKIRISSSPPGATVYVKGLEQCKTPCTFYVQRSLSTVDAELKLKGYTAKTFELQRTFNPVSLLNFFGLIGWGVDAATGAMMKYDRKGYDIELEKE